MKIFKFSGFLFALVLSFIFVDTTFAKNENSYTVKDKFAEIKANVEGTGNIPGFGSNGGIIDLKVKYKKPHEKNLTVNVTCPGNNYDQFLDICSQTFYLEGSTLRLHYLMKDNYQKSRKINFQFSIEEHVYFQDIVIPGIKLPEIQVSSPKKNKTFKEGESIEVTWNPYYGDFNLYSISLANKLVPGFGVNGKSVGKGLNSFSYNLSMEASYSGIVDNFAANFRDGNTPSKSKIAKNFYIIVEAHDANKIVAEGMSPVFKIK